MTHDPIKDRLISVLEAYEDPPGGDTLVFRFPGDRMSGNPEHQLRHPVTSSKPLPDFDDWTIQHTKSRVADIMLHFERPRIEAAFAAQGAKEAAL